MADIDKYDTNCPYNNKPCVGCGSFFADCPRCNVEKGEVEWMEKIKSNVENLCPYTHAKCVRDIFHYEGCNDCFVEREWENKVMKGKKGGDVE